MTAYPSVKPMRAVMRRVDHWQDLLNVACRFCPHHVRALLRYGIHESLWVHGRHVRHHTRIRDPQLAHPMHPQFVVHDARARVALGRHPTRARIVEHRVDVRVDVCVQRGVARDVGHAHRRDDVPILRELPRDGGGDAQRGAKGGAIGGRGEVAHVAERLDARVGRAQAEAAVGLGEHETCVEAHDTLAGVYARCAGVADWGLGCTG